MKRLLKANFLKNRKNQMNFEKIHAQKAELIPKLLAAGVELVSVDAYKDGEISADQDDTNAIIFNAADGEQVEVDERLWRDVELLLEMIVDHSKAGGSMVWDVSNDTLKHDTYQIVYDEPTGWPQPEEEKLAAPAPAG
jgi:hypothetical protein